MYDIRAMLLKSTLAGSLGDAPVIGVSFTCDNSAFVCCSSDNSISAYSLNGNQLYVVEANVPGEFRYVYYFL